MTISLFYLYQVECKNELYEVLDFVQKTDAINEKNDEWYNIYWALAYWHFTINARWEEGTGGTWTSSVQEGKQMLTNDQQTYKLLTIISSV